MRAFISHAFTVDDIPLAAGLADAIGEAGGTGYLAEKHMEYDLMIHEKIKGEISASDYLVAIITKDGQSSPSVHEEIGYALGKDKPVLIMRERGVKMRGVFAHGKDPEVFDRGRFDAHAGNIVGYMRRHLPRTRGESEEEGDESDPLLEERKIADIGSDAFARNEHYRLLYDWTMNDVGKPAVLFTACPRRLKARTDVASEEFEEWATARRDAAEPGSAIPIRGQDIERDDGSLVFYDRKANAPGGADVKSYCEFRDDGYFEVGTASRYTYNEDGERVLGLGHMIGAFWGFLVGTRGFYEKIGFGGPFDTFLSISNSAGLVLGNFGNEALRTDYRTSQEGREMRGMFKRARRKNLQVSRRFDGVQELTDKAIRDAAYDAAAKVAHAYGQKRAMCFGKNGEFAWDLYRRLEGEMP